MMGVLLALARRMEVLEEVPAGLTSFFKSKRITPNPPPPPEPYRLSLQIDRCAVHATVWEHSALI
jgi:hypothetical protein